MKDTIEYLIVELEKQGLEFNKQLYFYFNETLIARMDTNDKWLNYNLGGNPKDKKFRQLNSYVKYTLGIKEFEMKEIKSAKGYKLSPKYVKITIEEYDRKLKHK